MRQRGRERQREQKRDRDTETKSERIERGFCLRKRNKTEKKNSLKERRAEEISQKGSFLLLSFFMTDIFYPV